MTSYEELKNYQKLSLDKKIEISTLRIKHFYEYYNGKVFVSFSGGKDSTVLLHLVRSIYPNVKAVFSNTGLEYPEIVNFVKSFHNVDIVRPKFTFKQVIDKYGFPYPSKLIAHQVSILRDKSKEGTATYILFKYGIKQDGNKSSCFKMSSKWNNLVNAPFNVSSKCCDILKKEPLKEYEEKNNLHSYIGTMAIDSNSRQANYLKYGCNIYGKNPKSRPLSFWLNDDIWEYIKINNVKYCNIYDMGEKHTGCIYCMFGVNFEESPNRFERMKKHHPTLYDYCINKLNLKQVLDYENIPY